MNKPARHPSPIQAIQPPPMLSRVNAFAANPVSSLLSAGASKIVAAPAKLTFFQMGPNGYPKFQFHLNAADAIGLLPNAQSFPTIPYLVGGPFVGAVTVHPTLGLQHGWVDQSKLAGSKTLGFLAGDEAPAPEKESNAGNGLFLLSVIAAAGAGFLIGRGSKSKKSR